jgi:hypothetical protein
MRIPLICCLCIFILTTQIFHAQDYKVECRPLRANLTFDSLKSKDTEILVTIFYKNFGKSDCDNSRIFPNSNKECNLNIFKEKLILLLNKSSFVIPVRFQIFYWDNFTEVFYLEDVYNKKIFNNKNYLEIEDQMAFVDFSKSPEFYQKDSFISDLNNIAKTKLLDENFQVTSIFDFTKKLNKKGVVPFPCPGSIRALYKDSSTMFSGNTCPATSIPLDDMFIEHLTLLFRANLVTTKVANLLMEMASQDKKRIDTLEGNFFNQKKELDKLTRFSLSNNYLGICLDVAFASSGRPSQNLNNSNLNIARYQSYGFTMSMGLKKYFSVNIGLENSSFGGEIVTDNTECVLDDVLSNGLSIIRNTYINDLKEDWFIESATHIKLGISYVKNIKNKMSLSLGVYSGKYLRNSLFTSLRSGKFNYRAQVSGINDEIMNVNSLDLKDNVEYDQEFFDQFSFTGYNFDFNGQVNYSLNERVRLLGNIQLSYINLSNLNFNQESQISSRIDEFNSAMYNIKSLIIMPFSLGVGIGIKL